MVSGLKGDVALNGGRWERGALCRRKEKKQDPFQTRHAYDTLLRPEWWRTQIVSWAFIVRSLCRFQEEN